MRRPENLAISMVKILQNVAVDGVLCDFVRSTCMFWANECVSQHNVGHWLCVCMRMLNKCGYLANLKFYPKSVANAFICIAITFSTL